MTGAMPCEHDERYGGVILLEARWLDGASSGLVRVCGESSRYCNGVNVNVGEPAGGSN